MNSYRKVKSVAKDMMFRGDKLEATVLDTMKVIAEIVGSTLGPGGSSVLIERQDYGLPNILTKDGVTVFRNLGFQDPTKHAIMEVARDASVRTATEAGDGTTTATVLSYAVADYTTQYSKKNATVSPQRICRRIENVFNEFVEPTIKDLATTPTDGMLHAVAKLSANGEGSLADAVIEAFEAVGDDGNIAIVEEDGHSGYGVEQIKGFPITVGYELSCKGFYPKLLNDTARNRTFMEKPVFILYYGSITETQTIMPIMQKIEEAFQVNAFNHNVVIVATAFSDTVIAGLAEMFQKSTTIKAYPLVVPASILDNGKLQFLEDLSAVTGSTIFDPVTKPLSKAEIRDIKISDGVQAFESSRYRSTIYGIADEDLLIARAEQVKASLSAGDISEYDRKLIQQRLGNLTGGIAKIVVRGPSHGERREKRDRVEDAIFAVRGAKKFGCLPGGCWTLIKLTELLKEKYSDDAIVQEVLVPALKVPFKRLLSNCGLSLDEINGVHNSMVKNLSDHLVWDGMNNCYVTAFTSGILDSTPAVLEAIRNSFSVATLLGTLGGTVVYQRDDVLERQEAIDSNNFMKTMNGEG